MINQHLLNTNKKGSPFRDKVKQAPEIVRQIQQHMHTEPELRDLRGEIFILIHLHRLKRQSRSEKGTV